MSKVYDLLILGGGISACVFASSIINYGYKGKIAIIENGRDLGGRSSTRKSLINNGFKLTHGSPNFNIINSNNDLLLINYLNELIKNNFIKSDEALILEIDKNLDISTYTKNSFYKGDLFVPVYSINYFLKKLIDKGIKRKQLDLYFNTLITNLNFEKNNWIVSSKERKIFNAKFIVSSSNLIIHKRSRKILKTKYTPLREAIPEGANHNIDKIISLLNKQNYLERINYLIYTNQNYKYKGLFKQENIHFLLNDKAENELGFERIIFQKKEFQNIGIVIHTRNLSNNSSKKYSIISNKLLIEKFNHIFQHSNIINKLINYKDISIMRWRASQPTDLMIPKELQICEEFKIGFCGDWFDFSGFGRTEGAITSALNLSIKIMNFL